MLTKELEEAYLQKSLKGSELLDLLGKPYPAEKLDDHPISKRITSRTEPTGVPAVLEPYTYLGLTNS